MFVKKKQQPEQPKQRVHTSTFTARAAKRPLSHVQGGDADESASDSLVRINNEKRALAQQEFVRRKHSAATDQVSRLAAGHAQAAAAAEALADRSEGTIERAANRARESADATFAPARSLGARSPEHPLEAAAAAAAPLPSVGKRLAALMPPNDGHVNDVFKGSGGAPPPLEMRGNYSLVQQYCRESLNASDAPVVGQMGMRIAECASALVRETNNRPHAAPIPRLLASTVSPLEDSFLNKLVADVIREAGVPPHLNDPQNTTLQRMRQALPVSRRAHEEKMLRPPRAGEPACAMGVRCKGNQIICQGGGTTLMAFYYENEWADHLQRLNEGLQSRLADLSRNCLLCIRYDVNRFLVSTRNDNMQFRVDAPNSDSDPTPTLIQPHFNIVDVPGEYRVEDCNTPVDAVFEGILYPIVKPSLRHFRRVYDRYSNTVVFQQTFAYPKAPPAPQPAPTGAASSSSKRKSLHQSTGPETPPSPVGATQVPPALHIGHF